MAFLKSLINLIMPKSLLTEDTDPGDHYQRLERIRLNHDWIEVKITKTEKTYQSLILEIDVKNSELLIDDLFPPEGLDNLIPGDTLEISSQSRLALINFYTRILAREIRGGEACYRLELPEEVGRNHNRGAYRVYVDNEQGLEIEIYHKGEPLQDVRIINLSIDGLKISFANDISSELEKNPFFSDCLIRLPNNYDIDCDIDMHNIYRIHTPELHSLGGGTLTISNPQQRVKLQQFLAGVQREQRRREIRVV